MSIAGANTNRRWLFSALIPPMVSVPLAAIVLWGSGLMAAVFALALPVGILILLVPEVGLLLTLTTIPLEETGVLFQSSGIRLSLAKLFGALTFTAWLANAIVKRQTIRIPKPALLLGGYLLVAAFSLWHASEFEAGSKMWLRLATTAAFYLMILNMIDSWPKLYRALVAFTVASVLVFGFAVIQQHSSDFVYKQRGAKEIAENIQFGAQEDAIEADLLGNTVLRSGGTSYHPLLLALNTVLVLPILVFALYFIRGGLILKALLLGAVLIDLAAMASTASRSGFLMAVGVLAILVLKRIIRINRFTIATALICALAAWPLLPDGFKERVLNLGMYNIQDSTSLRYRVELVEAGLAVFRQHPLNGVGIGNLVEINNYMPTYNLGGFASGVHNMYIQVGLETGILGLGFIMAFFLITLRGFHASARAWDPPSYKAALAYTLSICVWVLLLYGLSLDIMNFGLKNAWFLLALQPVLLRLAEHEQVQGNKEGAGINQ